ncbi:type II toxin-antitoxin system RelE/ParE family toxin [Occallatibacter riparius]|uniref:Type II toxin-antitoxin system RelE/ParE family toxin n=1 Tax=Occallatibacter riparius TaxID=1002689 RepID=A0A9J7BNL8_9BACT|nr:type II toxin-antitoxin system RelE/ParE family toxin [Occallatibacter riparius]UWZ84320.1 type II toxin-antitoxin system RelE/ParE family toxin [Occallatibacter riparius]
MEWRVEVLNEIVQRELDELPKDIRARLVWISRLISQVGLETIREPHVKHLEGKLWEIRLAGRDGIARALYVTAFGRRVVIVRAFVKKTQQTPQSEINLGLRRAEEVR